MVSVSGLFEVELVRQLNQDLKSGLSSLNFKGTCKIDLFQIVVFSYASLKLASKGLH